MALSAAAAHQTGGAATNAIVVDRGEFDYAGNSGVLTLYGSRGFSLAARVSGTSGVMLAVDACATSCPAGAVIPLTASWSGNDLPAVVTLEGVTYTDVGSLSGLTSATVQFAGIAVTPPMGRPGRAVVTTPFTLTGEFIHADGDDGVVSDTLRGEGVAKVALVLGRGGWTVESVTYKFKHEASR